MNKTSTDLHIEYKLDTGKEHQWPYGPQYTGKFRNTEGYSREYAKWLEEQLIELLNKNN